jgi:PPK2 family polyphosphate:nucleotide phosphotransferase
MAQDSDDQLSHRLRRLLRVGGADQPGSGGPGPIDLAAIDPRGTPGLPDGVSRPAKGSAAKGTDAKSTDAKSTDAKSSDAKSSAAKSSDAKAWSRAEVQRLGAELAGHQERLYASAVSGGSRRRVLLVLQAMDCGGKDGTIKSVVRALNPMGVRVTAFGPPTPPELAQHFLWRINRQLPGAGQVGVFNRSHYEDVLAVRVRSLVPEPVWRARYDQINRFEQDLAADGLTIIKVMLHISAAEQRERMLARLEDPTKRWKFNPGDLEDLARWDDYQAAYAEALGRCSSDNAPWYVVPADRKWYRNWAVANLLLAHFDDLALTYPDVDLDAAGLRAVLDGTDTHAYPQPTLGKQ